MRLHAPARLYSLPFFVPQHSPQQNPLRPPTLNESRAVVLDDETQHFLLHAFEMVFRCIIPAVVDALGYEVRLVYLFVDLDHDVGKGMEGRGR